MARRLSYADAVRMLGGKRGDTVASLDRLTGGMLLGAAAATSGGLALNLFDPAGRLAKLSGELITVAREQFDGLRRFDRTQRLEAAHAVIVLVAFFEELSDARLPFDLEELELSVSDQLRLATGEDLEGTRLGELGDLLLRREVPCPAPQRTQDETALRIEIFYRELADSVERFLAGLAVWDRLDETSRLRALSVLADQPSRAVRRYEGLFRRLAVDFPEIAFWVSSAVQQASGERLQELSEGLKGLGRTLDALAIGRAPDQRRVVLNRSYRAALNRPILSAEEAPDGVVIPTLGDLYINPRYRLSSGGSAEELASERWWRVIPVRDDLQSFLVGNLTSPGATEVPLLVLGQPGSGKSAFSSALAGRLPASDFLAVIVPLREVPADTDVQTQIEYAIRTATGETVTWPELVRGAGEALPVVILDGFDELVQATGVSQSDFLERLAAFQRRESELGRPVAIVVTSRTAVADRTRSVNGMVAVRLEPFNDKQIRRWLNIWNSANSGRSPVLAEAVLAHSALASQPLLLMMLALYDAEGHTLQRETESLAQYDLYESLLTAFAVREVRKAGSALDEPAFRLAVEHELTRLAVVAFAMFNRGRQWAAGTELDSDLPALLGGQRAVMTGLKAPLTPGQATVGRFYFVHQAQAVRDGVELKTYEFLHATFGEFLVARLVIRELEGLTDTAILNARRGRQSLPEDDFLFALLSYTALATRNTVIDFLGEGLRSLPSEQLSLLKAELLGLFRKALTGRHPSAYDEYQPLATAVTKRHAAWSANLVILAVLAGEGITALELFPGAEDGVAWWLELSLLWRSQLRGSGWDGLVHGLDVRREWKGQQRHLRIELADESKQAPPIDIAWSYAGAEGKAHRSGDVATWLYHGLTDLRRHSSFLCDRVDDLTMHLAESFIGDLDPAVGGVHEFADGRKVTAAYAIVAVMTASDESLVESYERCIAIAEDGFMNGTALAERAGRRFRQTLLRLLTADRDRLPAEFCSWAEDKITP